MPDQVGHSTHYDSILSSRSGVAKKASDSAHVALSFASIEYRSSSSDGQAPNQGGAERELLAGFKYAD
jgi:hypothetical protein